MFVSPIKPLSVAFSQVGKMLFKPFQFSKWFTLGFLVWLSTFIGADVVWQDSFLSILGGFSDSIDDSDIETFFANHPLSDLQEIATFMMVHKTSITIVGVFFLSIILLFSFLFTWIGSRGKFAFMYNVGKNRFEIEKPWKIYEKEANSYMWFYYLFNLLFYMIFFMAVFIFFYCIIALETQEVLWNPGPWGFLLYTLLFLLALFLFSAIYSFMRFIILDFVLPIMFLRKVKFWKGVKIFLKEGLPQRFWSIILYGIIKTCLSLAAGFGIGLFCVLTCCIGFIFAIIPVLGAGLFLPVSVFFQSYNFAFIQEFGEGWNIFTDDEKEDISSGGLLNSAMKLHED